MGDMSFLKRKKSVAEHDDKRQGTLIRMSGTTVNIEPDVKLHPPADETELGPAIGRQGNDYKYPDADYFLVGRNMGDRLQDFANTHLSEGPQPGRIPHGWANRVKGVLGKHITGEPNGDTGVITANQFGGAEDQAFIPHIQIPRGSGFARAYSRTVDDAAPIPGIYVGDPTRR